MATNKGKGLFHEVKGKIVDSVEIKPAGNGYAIGILFQDKTYLAFEVDPFIHITPDFSDWKTENYKPLKRWRTIRSV